MNDFLPLFVGSETMIFTASVLIQATLVISFALLLGRWLRYQPALRHSVLIAGLICVCVCPLATHLADRVDVPGVPIAWLAIPDAIPDSIPTPNENSNPSAQPILAAPVNTSESLDTLEPVSTPEEATETLALPLSNITAEQPKLPSVSSTSRPVVATELPVKATISNENTTGLSDKTKQSISAGAVNRTTLGTNVANAVALVWLVGIVLISIRLLLAWRYLSHLRSNSRSINKQNMTKLAKVSEEVCRAVGVRQLPPLFFSDRVKGPISLGLFRPAIILPEEMTQELNGSQLRDILIHETAHIHRHDHLIVLLQRLVGAFFWPFPLVWRLNAKIDEAREDVCDNYVLGHTEAPQYSRMLLELTERAATPQAIPLAIGLWKCRRKLEQRVVVLLDPRRTTKTRLTGQTLLKLTVAFVLIAVLLTGSRFTRTTHAQLAEADGEQAKQNGEEAKQNGEEAKQNGEETKKDEEKKDVGNETKPATDQPDPFDALYDVIMTRYKDGKSYARDETSPAIFSWSEFPFGDKTFTKFNAALDTFAALPQDKIDQYSVVRRALLQRHLWEVFDSTFNWDWSGDWYWGGRKAFPKTHMARRTALQPKIASLIRRLALTEEQILKLPNPLAVTVKSGEFAQVHDPADQFKPFLPADLIAKESSWVCLGEEGESVPASTHTGKLFSRSIFLQFMRLPGGRTETLEYMERIKKRPEQFPVGTQFALMEQPFLISNEGKLVLSPMIVSVQLRAYLDVGRRFRSSGENKAITQSVAEFVMQPRQLMKGDAMMKAIGPNDFRYDAGTPFAAGFGPRDPFASGEIAGRLPTTTRLNLCMSCHGSAGGRGVRTTSFESTNAFTEVNTNEVRKATQTRKHKDEQWEALQKLLQSKSSGKIKAARLAELSKPTLHVIPPKKPMVKKFTVSKEEKTAPINRMELEMANELKKLHTAVLLSEVEKLSEMFSLDETKVNKLRLAVRPAVDSAVEKARGAHKAFVEKWVNYEIGKYDIDPTAISFNRRYVRIDREKKPEDKKSRHNLSARVERHSSNISIGVAVFRGVCSVQDAEVRKEETWAKALAGVVTAEQLNQYTEDVENRLKSTLVNLVMTALEFDLDLPDSKVPIVRKRIEERIKGGPRRISFIERTVGGVLQKLKANDLADILTKKQLVQRTDVKTSRIKSAIVDLVLEVLKIDLHLSESQLPAIRKRLEERGYPGAIQGKVTEAAVRSRWKLNPNEFKDILTEQQQILWPLTQHK